LPKPKPKPNCPSSSWDSEDNDRARFFLLLPSSLLLVSAPRSPVPTRRRLGFKKKTDKWLTIRRILSTSRGCRLSFRGWFPRFLFRFLFLFLSLVLVVSSNGGGGSSSGPFRLLFALLLLLIRLVSLVSHRFLFFQFFLSFQFFQSFVVLLVQVLIAVLGVGVVLDEVPAGGAGLLVAGAALGALGSPQLAVPRIGSQPGLLIVAPNVLVAVPLPRVVLDLDGAPSVVLDGTPLTSPCHLCVREKKTAATTTAPRFTSKGRGRLVKKKQRR
jgi:hypothetical protein